MFKYYTLISVFCLLLLFNNNSHPQDEDLIIGQTATKISAAFYDLSDPLGVNMEVNLWGMVRYPGRYRVTVNTTFLDLLSYAGGPNENSKLDDIRIYRPAKDTLNQKSEIFKLNYYDLIWNEKLNPNKKLNPTLKAGDIVIVLEEERYTLRENIAFFLPILSSLVSIITLIITLTRK